MDKESRCISRAIALALAPLAEQDSGARSFAQQDYQVRPMPVALVGDTGKFWAQIIWEQRRCHPVGGRAQSDEAKKP